jgi:PAS domain-containing protein
MRCVHRELAAERDAPICLFAAFDAPTQTVEVVWQIHNGHELPGGSFPLGNGFTSQVIRSGRPLLIREWANTGPQVQVHFATEPQALPQSAICAPVRFDAQVRGVISVQSYEPSAFDEDDLAHLSDVAEHVAETIFARAGRCRDVSTAAAVTPADTTVGVLVLDRRGRLVELNEAARRMLCSDANSVILGHPILQRQGRSWPLGTQTLTERLRPLLNNVASGATATTELSIEHTTGERFAWSASALLREGKPAGALLQFRHVCGH